jgi:hypothetical protein
MPLRLPVALPALAASLALLLLAGCAGTAGGGAGQGPDAAGSPGRMADGRLRAEPATWQSDCVSQGECGVALHFASPPGTRVRHRMAGVIYLHEPSGSGHFAISSWRWCATATLQVDGNPPLDLGIPSAGVLGVTYRCGFQAGQPARLIAQLRGGRVLRVRMTPEGGEAIDQDFPFAGFEEALAAAREARARAAQGLLPQIGPAPR